MADGKSKGTAGSGADGFTVVSGSVYSRNSMYNVTCPHCGAMYDASRAAECHCLHPVRSFECPHCSKCFCEAGKGVLDRFWAEAPPAVWERRRTREKERQLQEQNEPPETIARPVVLFADDDKVGRAIARKVLTGLGCGVVIASDGDEALELARRYQPELLITDALMPRRDGREVGLLVKQMRPETKVVVITSVYRDPRYKHEAFTKFGADAYLSKPISAADLRALVEKHLPSARQGEDNDIIF